MCNTSHTPHMWCVNRRSYAQLSCFERSLKPHHTRIVYIFILHINHAHELQTNTPKVTHWWRVAAHRTSIDRHESAHIYINRFYICLVAQRATTTLYLIWRPYIQCEGERSVFSNLKNKRANDWVSPLNDWDSMSWLAISVQDRFIVEMSQTGILILPNETNVEKHMSPCAINRAMHSAIAHS